MILFLIKNYHNNQTSKNQSIDGKIINKMEIKLSEKLYLELKMNIL